MQYLNNGKIAQNSLIHSTSIKSANIKIKNGKTFTKMLNVAVQENNLEKSNSISPKKESSLVNWLINTLNPINHIPIVSTINNMVNKTNKSLDIVQSAIGGAIYGGGPIGLTRGIGGWFFNKLIPKNRLANNSEVLVDTPPKNNNLKSNKKFLQNISNPSTPFQSPQTSLKESEKNFNISIKHIKTFSNNSLYYHSLEQKQKKHLVDINA